MNFSSLGAVRSFRVVCEGLYEVGSVYIKVNLGDEFYLIRMKPTFSHMIMTSQNVSPPHAVRPLAHFARLAFFLCVWCLSGRKWQMMFGQVGSSSSIGRKINPSPFHLFRPTPGIDDLHTSTRG